MAALPYIQLYVADYLADTMHLTTEEHGAYLLLIMNYWQTGRAIPKKRLASVARLSNERWTDVEITLNEFFTETAAGEWFHARIEDDLSKVRGKSEKASAAGKASAAKRAASETRINTEPGNGRSTDVEDSLQRKGNHTDTDTDTDTDTEEDYVPTVQVISAAPKRPAIPVQEIINLYHAILPFGSRCAKTTRKRRQALEALWRSGDLPDLDAWREYFERAAKSKFIRGEVPPQPGHVQFRVSIDYLIREDSYAKALENTGAFRW